MDLLELYRGCPFVDRCLVARCLHVDGGCAENLCVTEFAAGETIFKQGSPASGCYVLCRGRVKLTYARAGRTLCLGIVEPGELLGEEALLDPEYRTCAEALEACYVVYLERSRLRSLLHDFFEVDLWLLGALSKRCKACYESAVDHAYRPAEERLIDLLESLGARYGPKVPLSQAELAEMLGVGRDTVNRCLQELKRRGAVEVGRRAVQLRTLPNRT